MPVLGAIFWVSEFCCDEPLPPRPLPGLLTSWRVRPPTPVRPRPVLPPPLPFGFPRPPVLLLLLLLFLPRPPWLCRPADGDAFGGDPPTMTGGGGMGCCWGGIGGGGGSGCGWELASMLQSLSISGYVCASAVRVRKTNYFENTVFSSRSFSCGTVFVVAMRFGSCRTVPYR